MIRQYYPKLAIDTYPHGSIWALYGPAAREFYIAELPGMVQRRGFRYLKSRVNLYARFGVRAVLGWIIVRLVLLAALCIAARARSERYRGKQSRRSYR